MKSRKYHQLKRNPLVRLIRSIYKFLNSLFKPKRAIARPTHRRSISTGELLEQVKWQFPQENLTENSSSDTRKKSPDRDVSRN
jgi:hypothetical protein